MLPLAITSGDPAGIGPEIVLKAFAANLLPHSIVIGDCARLSSLCVALDIPIRCQIVERVEEAQFRPAVLSVVQVGDSMADLPFGQISRRAGAAAFAYVDEAISLALLDRVAGIVTAPINKEALAAAGIPYSGHTEILAVRAGADAVAMMLISDALKVVLVTVHQSLMSVGSSLTIERELTTIRLADAALRKDGARPPRLAVAGLNPHAGENGMFGHEDETIIRPAVEKARREGIDVSGPFPPDTIFYRARRGEFDLVVAQYHDQGLIPLKLSGIDTGVNITLGLPFVRTSVDHGTAFDIAGTGAADPSSLVHAIRYASELAATRRAQ